MCSSDLDPDGTYTYTPDPGFSGTDTFTYQLCSIICVTATETIVVGPNAVDYAYTTPFGTALTTGDVATADTYPAGAGFAQTSDPAHGTVTWNGDGTYTYTPDPGFTGSDAFTFTVDDGTSVSSSAIVTISVMAPADLPCQDATRTIDAGTSLSVATWLAAVPVLCTAPGGAVVTVDGTPTAGSGSIDGAGAYTPPSGFLGTDLVTVGVVAGGGAARGTATLAVSVVDPAAPTGAGIGIGDVSVWEGDARTRSMAFPVTLATANAAPVTVRYVITGIEAIEIGRAHV